MKMKGAGASQWMGGKPQRKQLQDQPTGVHSSGRLEHQPSLPSQCTETKREGPFYKISLHFYFRCISLIKATSSQCRPWLILYQNQYHQWVASALRFDIFQKRGQEFEFESEGEPIYQSDRCSSNHSCYKGPSTFQIRNYHNFNDCIQKQLKNPKLLIMAKDNFSNQLKRASDFIPKCIIYIQKSLPTSLETLSTLVWRWQPKTSTKDFKILITKSCLCPAEVSIVYSSYLF